MIEMDFDKPLSLADLRAMTITAATELTSGWLERLPGARQYLDSGWGMSVEVVLVPRVSLILSVIDPADSSRFPIGRFDLPLPPLPN